MNNKYTITHRLNSRERRKLNHTIEKFSIDYYSQGRSGIRYLEQQMLSLKQAIKYSYHDYIQSKKDRYNDIYSFRAHLERKETLRFDAFQMYMYKKVHSRVSNLINEFGINGAITAIKTMINPETGEDVVLAINTDGEVIQVNEV